MESHLGVFNGSRIVNAPPPEGAIENPQGAYGGTQVRPGGKSRVLFGVRVLSLFPSGFFFRNLGGS